ncbi:MAG: aminotransferase class I/II-fold pyridoxal phosphate-dependent enzyme [Lachnospiraceae bacterium]|nr:aminotransferase class I/II-fold pyridoxal phosphate-dependent enzyme [Lachnospiraceae bacterium]
MQAIILAAGMGKRLKELTQNNTKCMVKVNGVTLIERVLRQIEKQNVSRIVLVVGYEREKLKEFIATLNIQTPIVYVENPVYDKTNNIYSLALASDYLVAEDTLLFESDIIIEDSILDMLVEDPRPTLALVDKYAAWMDGTCLKLAEDDSITAFVPGKKLNYDEKDAYYKTVNIYKFAKEFSKNYYVPFLEAYQKAMGENEYYEQVLRILTMLSDPMIKAKRLSGQRWYEIDDAQDLDIATSLFAEDPAERAALLASRYGGYWRYPDMLDFCYLVNPYFPPKRMEEEMKASFHELLTQYPSGMRVNAQLAAKNFGVHEEHILVGNGAAELIKALMENLEGKVGFVRPTFEEYPHRYAEERSVSFIPENPDYSYTADDLMNFFADKDISSLVVVNPDNPSGSYIPKQDVLRLAKWAGEKQLTLVIDESFVDFADEEDSSLIYESILNEYPHLFVMKSISKSYGIPGIRLGVLASANEEMIACLKKDVAIWNINSFGEFYMQIAEKYKNDYTEALVKFREERKRFESELSAIPGLRVMPSQANYVFAELENGISAKELTQTLLINYNLLIKELTSKTGGRNYLRLAIRCKEDDDRLIEALKKELSDR